MQVFQTWINKISLVGPFLILLGVLRLYSYYSVFKINILNYLDFSEFILSFFGCGFVIVSFLSIGVIYACLISKTNRNQGSQKASDRAINNRIICVKIFLLGVLVCCIPAIFALNYYHKLTFIEYYGGLLGVILAFSCPLIVIVIFWKRLKIDPTVFSVISLLLFALIFDYTFNKVLAYRTLFDAPVSISFKERQEHSVASDSNSIYVGRTRQYFFIYVKDHVSSSMEAYGDLRDRSKDTLTVYSSQVSAIRLVQKKSSIVFNSFW